MKDDHSFGMMAVFSGRGRKTSRKGVVTVLEMMRRDIVHFGRRMHADGLVVGTAGNISCRVPGREEVAITPSGFPYNELQPDDIPILDLEGNVLREGRPPSTEWRLHLAIYRARPDVGAVIHTHEVYSSVLAVLRIPLPPVVEELVHYVGGQIEVAAYAPSQSEELSRSVVMALGNKAAALMANHGNVSCGKDLSGAYHVCQLVGRVAKIYVFASLLGKPSALPGAVIEQERREFERNQRVGEEAPAKGGDDLDHTHRFIIHS